MELRLTTPRSPAGSYRAGTGALISQRRTAREAGCMGPLHGYRVIELATWVAGPAAASMLADWGADVIKVEAPAGDPNRYTLLYIGVDVASSPAFALDNRGKRGVVLDLK